MKEKNIVDRQYLSMEPFDRNCSYKSVNFSHTKISLSTIASSMRQCFKLLVEGHIKPINPITHFGFDSIPEAFAYMRENCIGKVVVIDGEKELQQTYLFAQQCL